MKQKKISSNNTAIPKFQPKMPDTSLVPGGCDLCRYTGSHNQERPHAQCNVLQLSFWNS